MAIEITTPQKTEPQSSDVSQEPPLVEVKDDFVKDESKGDKKSLDERDRSSRSSKAFLDAMETVQGQTITSGIISLLIVALLFLFAIAPAVSSIRQQLEVNDSLRKRIARQESKRASLNSLSQKESTYSPSFATFSELFGEERHQAQIYDELIGLADRSNMQFRSMAFDPENADGSKYNEIGVSERLRFQSVRLAVYGRYGNIDNLTASLEESARVMDIIDINVTPDDEVENTGNINITVTTFYWQFK